MLRVQRPGLAGVSSSPQDPSQAYLLQNMVKTDDGVWRPRPGSKLVRDWNQTQDYVNISTPSTANGGELVHLRRWSGNLIFGANRVTFTADPGNHYLALWGYRESNDTVYPLTGLGYIGGATPPHGWFPSVPVIQSLDDGTRTDMIAFTNGEGGFYHYASSPGFAATQPASFDEQFQANWLSTHGGYLLACVNRDIYWSEFFDPTQFPTTQRRTSDHEVGTPVATVPFQHGISFILGRSGFGELQGAGQSGFQWRPTLALKASPAPNTIVNIAGDCFFLIPGPRLVRMGLGGPEIISGPVDRELRALATLRDLRAWHDSLYNLYCLSDPVSGKTHLYSLEERRWIGHWSRGDSLMWLGEAAAEAALDSDSERIDYASPFATAYVAAGTYLCRWDPSLAVDQVSTDSEDDLPITVAVETIPEDAPRMSNLKQLSDVTVNGRGTWTVKLRYRNEQDAAWTDVTVGTLTAPGKVYGPLTAYKQSVVRLESTDPTARFVSLEVSETNRGGY